MRRVTRLYLLDPGRIDGACASWLLLRLDFQFAYRQANWEHLNWLHTGKELPSPSNGASVTTPSGTAPPPAPKKTMAKEWALRIKRRDSLANHYKGVIQFLDRLRPASWPRQFDELLQDEPAFWHRPAQHCTFVFDAAALLAGTESPAAQSLRIAGEEPLRMQ